jgi:hypothetical protein
MCDVLVTDADRPFIITISGPRDHRTHPILYSGLNLLNAEIVALRSQYLQLIDEIMVTESRRKVHLILTQITRPARHKP